MDLRRIPTADLEALQAGDLSKVSTQTLNYMQRASSPTSQPKATQQKQQGDGASFSEGLVHGLKMTGMGALQTVLEGGEKIRNLTGMQSNKANVDKVQSMVNEEKKSYTDKGSSFAGGAGELVGGTIPYLVMPGASGTGLWGRLVTSGAQGAIIGGMQPTSEDQSRTSNAMVGGVMGVAGQGVVSAVGKGANAIAGKVAKNETEVLADKFGIRATLGESTDNAITKKGETILEGVPFVGLKRFREKQSQEAQTAAKDFLSKYIADPAATDTMQVNRQFAGQLFEWLKAEVKGIDVQKITPSETKTAAKELLARYPDIFKKFQDTKREGIIQSIITDTKPVKSPILNAQGKNYQNPMTATFDEMWTLRSGVGEMIGQAKKKLASGEIDKTTYSELSKLYSAVNKDIDGWITTIGRPDLKGAISSANNAYKQYVVKYDVIQKAYDKAIGTVGANEMFSPKTFSTALKNIVYKNKSTNTFTPSEITEMTGLANIMQVVKRAGQFKENPPTGNRWGLPAILAGAGEAAYLAGGAMTAMKTGGATLGIAAVSSFLTGTPKGKLLAKAASKYEPNSPQMQFLVNQLYKSIPQATSVGFTQ